LAGDAGTYLAEVIAAGKEEAMKRALWLPIALVLVFAAGCIVYVPTDESGQYPASRDEESYYRGGERDVSVFYDDLAPYGTWVDMPRYGYVWVPRHMHYGWRPYTHGRWVWTDYGWTWISAFEWGWIPFHYGRWGYDRDLGWYWVPDTVWGPAWVAWRTGGDFCGWAPLPPEAEFMAGVGIRGSGFDIPSFFWIFVHGRNFWNDGLDRYVLPYERNLTIINYTVVNIDIRARGGRVYNEGFDPEAARRITRREVTRYRLRDAEKAGPARLERDEVIIHKPVLTRNRLARPKIVLRPSEAEEELADDIGGEADIDQEIIRQRKLLEESQEEEIQVIRRKVDEDRKLVRTPDEKLKLEREAEVKVLEIRKKHEAEKVDLEKRKKADEAKVKSSRLKKKE
jgi:hypothetical protein